MEKNLLKDLFNQQRYNDVINNLKYIFSDLYIEMLDFKSNMINENYKDLKYYELTPLIRKYYPQFSDNITLLDVSLSDVNQSYLDNINDLLTTYLYFKENYKLNYNKEKYKDVDVDDVYVNDDNEEKEIEFYTKIYDEIHKNGI